jgi:hypothetical protein
VFSIEICSTFVFLLFLSEGITPQNFYKLTRLQSVTYRFFVWYINMVLILTTQRVEKSLLELSRFNMSKDLGVVLKMHSGELKIRFMPTAPIHIISYTQNFFHCLQVSKCVFICNKISIRVPLICFKINHHQNFFQLTGR